MLNPKFQLICVFDALLFCNKLERERLSFSPLKGFLYKLLVRKPCIKYLAVFVNLIDAMSEKMRKQALQLISENPLSLKELAEKMGIKEKKAFNILKNLFEKGQIDCFKDADNVRRYKPSKSPVSDSMDSEAPIEDIKV